MRIRKRYIKGPVYLTIAASIRSPDIRALAISAGWQGYEPIYCTINAGVDVVTLTVQNLPDHLLQLINKGRIGGVVNGGTGLLASCKFSLVNTGGIIFGGGGDGGDGGSAWARYTAGGGTVDASGGRGGGGAGFNTAGALTFVNSSAGDTGQYSEYSGAVLGGDSRPWARGGSGGSGGAMGANGSPGNTGDYGGSAAAGSRNTGQGGVLAGYAIDGWANVNVLAAGSILGRTR